VDSPARPVLRRDGLGGRSRQLQCPQQAQY
jgi:hypothetical protein